MRANSQQALVSDQDLARQELGKKAYREVQVARRRKRESEDEVVLFQGACSAGFGTPDDATTTSGGSEEELLQQVRGRRKAINSYLSARAEAVMEGIAAQQPLSKAGVDFTLEVAPSRELPQPIAGDGVFIKEGNVPAGTLVAFYPGSVYMPHEVRWLGGYGPTLDRAGQDTSSHVIGRFGGVRIDGLWSGIEVPADEYMLEGGALDEAVAKVGIEKENEAGLSAARADVEAFCAGLIDPVRTEQAKVPFPKQGGDRDSIRHLNPLAVGEMINHPPAGRSANVLGWPVDLNLYGSQNPEKYAQAVPNTYALRAQGQANGAPCPYTVVMVTAEALGPGDELWLDYGCELLPVEDIPVWFVPASLRGDVFEADVKAHPALAIQNELHAWKERFAKENGRKPTRHDLVNDPIAVELFTTFQKYRKLGDL